MYYQEPHWHIIWFAAAVMWAALLGLNLYGGAGFNIVTIIELACIVICILAGIANTKRNKKRRDRTDQKDQEKKQ